MNRIYMECVLAFCLVAGLGLSAEPVAMTVVKGEKGDAITLENYRVKMVISPARGGAVTSWSDKLAPAELVSPKEFNGLCMDHLQEQSWPGELLEVPYEYKIVKQDPAEVRLMLWRKVSGLWREKLANKKLSDILLEKTYVFRADSPSLTCSVKLTAPADEAKVFSYWLQNVFFAGGDYDAVGDRMFRPTARGVRNNAREKNGFYGDETWMRDFSDGWMALVDVKKKTGLAMVCDYNDLRINYACGGNLTAEFMFNTLYLPKGQSRTYEVQLTPIIGLDKVLHAGPRMIVGYAVSTDNRGSGKVDFMVERSAEAVGDLKFDVAVAGAVGGKEVKAGTPAFVALTDQPQTQSLALSGLPPDPVVVRVAASGHGADGKEFSVRFEDFFPGAYQWGDNIQTDMRTPVYAAERPPQKLSLAKPEKLQMIPTRVYRGQGSYNKHLFFQGLLDEAYNVAASVHAAGYSQETDVIYYRYGGSWYGELTDFPYDYEKLLGYDCIILGGVSKSGLKPIGIEMLHDYLLASGGMVVLGSHGAYGRSQLKGTALGDAFPVEFNGGIFDLVSVGGKPVVIGPDPADFLKGLKLSDQATCWLIHPATPKPGAKVLMQVDGKPFMVAGEYGENKARIVCILGAPMGDADAKQKVPFWKDPQWYLVLRNAIWWTSQNDFRFKE